MFYPLQHMGVVTGDPGLAMLNQAVENSYVEGELLRAVLP